MKGAGTLKAAAIGALLVALFAASVVERRPSFGTLEGRAHEWLTGRPIKFTRAWWDEGALKLRFTMFDNPRSIEFPTVASREPYLSYPPGCVLPIWAASKILNRAPDPPLVMSVDLANQFLGAVAIFLLLWITLEGLALGEGWRFAFALLGDLLFVGLPGPMHWFQNVYFSDQAIVLPVTLVLLCEAALDRGRGPRWRVAQSLLVGWGVFVDWFMVPVAAALMVKWLMTRWRPLPWSRRLREAALFLAPAAFGLALFVAQLASLHGFETLRQRFVNRAGLEAGTPYVYSDLYSRFWNGHVVTNFGSTLAPWLLLFAILIPGIVALGRSSGRRPSDPEAERIIGLWFLLVAPPIVHSMILWNHTLDHAFTPLRFLPAFACLPFALAPLLLLRELRLRGGAARIVMAAAIAAGGALLVLGHRGFVELARPQFRGLAKIGTSLRNHTVYEDVMLSSEFQVPMLPPELLSYSMKRVYLIDSPDSIRAWARKLPDEARLRFVLLTRPKGLWQERLAGLPSAEYDGVLYYELGRASDLRGTP